MVREGFDQMTDWEVEKVSSINRVLFIHLITDWPRHEKTCLQRCGNNADQPAHPCSLIIPLFIRSLERIISGLATS